MVESEGPVKASCHCGAQAQGCSKHVLYWMTQHTCPSESPEIVESASQNQIGFMPDYTPVGEEAIRR